MTKDQLQTEFTTLHESFMKLAHQFDLQAIELQDAKDHVRKLQIIICNRYASQKTVTPEAKRWVAAAAYAREHHGVTVQEAMKLVTA